jgi:hypothetical protein
MDEAHTKLRRRVGHAAANAAELRLGFDPGDADIIALLPTSLHDLLCRFDRPAPAPAADFEMLVDCRVTA